MMAQLDTSRRAMLGLVAVTPLLATPLAARPAASSALAEALRRYNQDIRTSMAEEWEWDDDRMLALHDRGHRLCKQVAALPNTTHNLHLRALAIGAAVDNTDDLANLDLGELAAHAHSIAGELVRQILVCVTGGVA